VERRPTPRHLSGGIAHLAHHVSQGPCPLTGVAGLKLPSTPQAHPLVVFPPPGCARHTVVFSPHWLPLLTILLPLHRCSSPCWSFAEAPRVAELQHPRHRLPLRHWPQLTVCSSMRRASPPEPVAASCASPSHAIYPTLSTGVGLIASLASSLAPSLAVVPPVQRHHTRQCVC
jgi:hypothetical protein